MGYNLIPCDRGQQFLMPPSLSDWLPQDHLARFVCEVVDELDLGDFYQRRRQDGWGRAAYDPRMMVGLLLYSYCIGCRSSRQIERRCLEDVASRFICANKTPDHATIARFRKDHQKQIAALFVQALKLCFEAGLVKVGVVALDGMRVKANASITANKTVKAIEQEVQDILKEAEAIDTAEDRVHGEGRGDELPRELRSSKGRLVSLKQAKARLEEQERTRQGAYEEKVKARQARQAELGRALRGRKPKPSAPDRTSQVNITDPDSRILKSQHWFIQGYNAQALVSEDQIILAADVTNRNSDVSHLHPMLKQARANLEESGSTQRIGILLADAGYYSDSNVAEQDEDGPELLIATTKGWKQRKEAATRPPRGRIPKALSSKERMERKLSTKRGQSLYKKRGQTVEPIFGQHVMRSFGGFSRRGLDACRCDWRLEGTAHNLLKLWRSTRSSRKERPPRRMASFGRYWS